MHPPETTIHASTRILLFVGTRNPTTPCIQKAHGVNLDVDHELSLDLHLKTAKLNVNASVTLSIQ